MQPESFDDRTYAALTYVRSFLTEIDGVPTEVEERFTELYSPEERTRVIAAMKGMMCVNLMMNDWRWASSKVLPGRDGDPAGACTL